MLLGWVLFYTACELLCKLLATRAPGFVQAGGGLSPPSALLAPHTVLGVHVQLRSAQQHAWLPARAPCCGRNCGQRPCGCALALLALVLGSRQGHLGMVGKTLGEQQACLATHTCLVHSACMVARTVDQATNGGYM